MISGAWRCRAAASDSAAFNLGLLQALGTQGALGKCHYLSTVSGGGYIGSCLSALCATLAVDVTPQHFPLAFQARDERSEVRHLRLHAQYLLPRHGLFTLDTWRLVSAYLGGLLFTLVMSGALLGIGAALAIVIYPVMVSVATELRTGSPPAAPGAFWQDPHPHWLALFMPALKLRSCADGEVAPSYTLQAPSQSQAISTRHA